MGPHRQPPVVGPVSGAEHALRPAYREALSGAWRAQGELVRVIRHESMLRRVANVEDVLTMRGQGREKGMRLGNVKWLHRQLRLLLTYTGSLEESLGVIGQLPGVLGASGDGEATPEGLLEVGRAIRESRVLTPEELGQIQPGRRRPVGVPGQLRAKGRNG